MTRLKTYRNKRDLDNTPEPPGDSTGAAGRRYVLHKHDARQLHYDLRLEQDGVLRSWALPKGPSLAAGEKRLAVEVEDHPLAYRDFEGVIPKNAYGGGTVMVWDQGEWARTGRNRKDRIDFVLHGEKLQGAWTLVRMTGKNGDKRKGGDRNWLLIKRHDADGGAPDAETLAGLGDQSVLSGRTMSRIAADEEGDEARSGQPPDPRTFAASHKRRLPATVQPQLATLVRDTPRGGEWLHEFKLDGYRLLARLKDKRVRLLTRNDKDWTDRFPDIAAALARLPVDEALLDGEAIMLGTDGISHFGRLQEALSAGRTEDAVYQAFDLLHLDGYDLMPVSQMQRKQALSQLLASGGHDSARNNGVVRYTDHVAGRGREFFDRACSLGLEGVVSKQADSAYATRRGKQWLKVKCVNRNEFVVGGFTDPKGSRTGFGALLLGAYDDSGRLLYSGRVGTGFNRRQLSELHRTLKKDERRTSPFTGEIPDTRATHWVRPRLVVDIEYTQRTRDGRLRHPSFRGLREDKSAADVHLPRERPTPRREPSKRRRRTSSSRDGDATVAGVRLSHPHRVLYPDMGVTKLDLARHLESVQDWIMPALADRPLSLLRCPDGWNSQCFFQKHPDGGVSERVPRIPIAEKKGRRDYAYVRSIEDLVALVQAGTLELHVWGSRIDDIERPDRLVFDIDPAPEVAWKEVLRVARGLRDRLDELGLTSFVRTTGGKGLHLVVPLTRGVGWDDAKAFAHAVSRQYARAEPKRLTTNMSKHERRGRIFIDYLRNARGATAVASYSPRAREGAPVAVPIRWDELRPTLRSDRYRIDNLSRRLSTLHQDPWADFGAARRPITKKMLRAAGID